MATVRYFIPEDGDSELQPNMFLAPKSRQQGYPPTLGQVKSSFPLPGRYHFRFKSPLIPGSDRDKDAMAVWMDCVDDHAHVPTWKASVIAKVTRIGIEDDDDDEEEDDDDSDFVRSTTPNPASSMNSSSVPNSAASPSLDIFDSAPRVHSTPAAPSSNHQASPNLLDGHHPSASGSSTGAMNGGGGGGGGGGVGTKNVGEPLLDMGFQQAPSPVHHDFFGMTTTTTPSAMNSHSMGGPSPPVSGNFRPPPAAPMSGGYNNNNHNAQQYGRPPQQQQQTPNAFNQFSQQNGPFGDLGTPWKT